MVRNATSSVVGLTNAYVIFQHFGDQFGLSVERQQKARSTGRNIST